MQDVHNCCASVVKGKHCRCLEPEQSEVEVCVLAVSISRFALLLSPWPALAICWNGRSFRGRLWLFAVMAAVFKLNNSLDSDIFVTQL